MMMLMMLTMMLMMMKTLGFDIDMKSSMTMSSRLEDAMARLTLAIEEMEESRREEEHKKEVGDRWKEIARVTDRLEFSHLMLSS